VWAPPAHFRQMHWQKPLLLHTLISVRLPLTPQPFRVARLLQDGIRRKGLHDGQCALVIAIS
jgi:hypothetical protein